MTSTHTLPRVSILMAESGGGHRSAALSLSEAMAGLAQVTFLDLLDDYAPFPINQLSAVYGPWVNYAPKLYALTYRVFTSPRQVMLAERIAYPFVRKRLTTAFAEANPNLVISVHPMQTAVPLRVLRNMGNHAPFITVVTDPVSPPTAWFCPHVDLCVVATEPARAAALASGMVPERVEMIGLPIRQAFVRALDQPKPAARVRLGLHPERPLLLLTGGGAGIGKLLPIARAVARRLAGHASLAQIAIIAGHNQALLRQLHAESWPMSVTILGFVEDMAGWLSAADLLISKAGPGTLAEAACVGVPVIITGFVPGQEAGNVTWFEQSGAGVFASVPERVAALVDEWFQPGDPTLSEMAVRARSAGQPDAARRIAETALALYHATRVL